MRIAIVGNAAGGKTALARRLAENLRLPLHHVDTYQFTADLKIRPFRETIEILNELQSGPFWIIDGFGPLDLIEKRFELADKIIFVDLPLWRHYLWASKRQLTSLFTQRSELPKGAKEFSFNHTIKLYKTIWRIHHRMRPELLKIFGRENLKYKTIHIKRIADFDNSQTEILKD